MHRRQAGLTVGINGAPSGSIVPFVLVMYEIGRSMQISLSSEAAERFEKCCGSAWKKRCVRSGDGPAARNRGLCPGKGVCSIHCTSSATKAVS